ncbi:MAG: thioredoxin family protein [Candidatus Margulisbacteria bacterium]|nr:thioredoxin family protein [Candidatus Margulisiibacteriota bacterium]
MRNAMLLVAFCSAIAYAAPRISWSVLGTLPNGHVLTQIHHQLPQGWHTYWKNPGDSGQGARISPITPEVTFGPIEFPKPSVIPAGPLVTYGYTNQVTYNLPMLTPPNVATIRASFEWLECLELCIQKDATIALSLPPTMPAITTPQPPRLPITAKKNWRSISLMWPTPVKTAAFFPYHNQQFSIGNAKASATQLRVPLITQALPAIEGELFLDNHPPIALNLPIQTSPFTTAWLAILGAFIGGLLLNIMPCVLPILGIKALQLQQRPSTTKITNALHYAMGVSGSLLALYAVLLLLKASGSVLGWGFQLQSPIIIQGLIVLFLGMMAIHLSIIHLPLPSWASRPSNTMWLSGVLTTVIATPCTAPFLGSALSVALFQSPMVGLLIFLSLSMGLALPMALIILIPRVGRWLPKSGAWNQRIKSWLNLGFVATIAWLMWVLHAQINPRAWLMFVCICVGTFFWLTLKSNAKKTAPMLAMAALVIVGALIMRPSASISTWHPYSKQHIAQLEAKYSPYFIDVTAKWCITCQTNKLTVLNTPAAQSLFKQKNLALIQADWTNRSPNISALLTTHGQASIPTYIYFDGQRHVVFGNVLSHNKLKEHLK